MILIHGYGGGGAIFYRILKDLSSYFHLYIVDLLGMGSSGRSQFPLSDSKLSVKIAEDFFVDSLKLWKEKLGLKNKVYLAGHSFGAYISAIYTLRYPEEIEKLLLISPAGIPEKPFGYNISDFAENFETLPQRQISKIAFKFWEKDFTPFHLFRLGGQIGSKALLNYYLQWRMDAIKDREELNEVRNYLHQIFLHPPSGEYALNSILSAGAFARDPLIHRLPYLTQLHNAPKVSFIYGETDWVDPANAIILIEGGLMPDASMHIVEKSQHHVYLDNPLGLVQKIILEIFG